MYLLSLLPNLILLASIIMLVSPSMFWRYWRKEKAKTLNYADTDEFELPESGLLSAIMLHIKIQNSNDIQAQVEQALEKHITKLEVVGDGDQTLYELSGEECHAHTFYNDGVLQPETRTLYGNKTQRSMFAIEFGRHLGDLEFMVDMSKWSDLKLKITNDFTTTQFTAAQANADIFYLIADGAVPSISEYLKTWEYSGDKPGADAQYMNKTLPKRYSYRRLMYQLDPDRTAATDQVAQDPIGDSYGFKFGFKEFKEVLYDCRPKDLLRLNARQFGKIRAGQRLTPSTTIYQDMQVAYCESVVASIIDEGASADVTVDTFKDGNERFQTQNFKGGATFAQVMAIGLGYLHTFVLDFDFRKERSDWIVGAEKDPIDTEWYGHKDDHTLRIIPTVPRAQGEA